MCYSYWRLTATSLHSNVGNKRSEYEALRSALSGVVSRTAAACKTCTTDLTSTKKVILHKHKLQCLYVL